MKNLKSQLKGIVVPLITPLTVNEVVDENALRKIVNYTIDSGVHGLFVNSTTGEGVCLTNNEKKRNLEIVLDATAGRVPVYAGVSDTSTKRALECIEDVQKSNADILVAHAPFYYPPNNQQELVDYYSTIARNANLPVMIYNIPFTTQAPLTINSVRELLAEENIIGIKDSSVDYVFLLNLIELKKIRPDFRIFIGKTHMWTAGILSGADGGLDGISNLVPKHCVNLYKAIVNKESNAYELQREINEIFRVYECRSFLGGIKMAMHIMGLCEPYTVHPITGVNEEEKAKIKGVLQKNNILKG